jgi:threonine synthase
VIHDAGYRCVDCSTVVPVEPDIWRCPHCHGLLDLDGHVDASTVLGDAGEERSMWRYASVIPVLGDRWRQVTMGEGMTPMVPVDAHRPHVRAKVEFLMPTLSFKDRGAAVLVSLAADLGVEHLVVDSSGNAGTAIAAYAARADIAADVFVSAHTSPGKRAQIERFGATVRAIDGDRSDVAAAAIAEVAATGRFYASHVHNPYFVHGTKTYLYELWEACGHQLPDVLVLPLGNGTLVLGCALAIDELQRASLLRREPRIVAVQSANCAPLHDALLGRPPGPVSPTIAEGVAIAHPARAPQILDAIRATDGTIVVATDDEVHAARSDLAAAGLDVEPTAAITLAGYRVAVAADAQLADAEVVLALCAAGLKSS